MKRIKCLLVFLISLNILAGCASSEKNKPQEAKAETVEYSREVSETLSETQSSDSETEVISETVSEAVSETTESAPESTSESISSDAKTENNTNISKNQHTDTAAQKSDETQIRIIATSASVCDIMDRLGLSLVGVPETTVSGIASRYNGVTTVGSPMSPDMEIIKSLKPTDVISPDTLENDLKPKYDSMGINSTFLNLRSVKGLYDSVKLIGDKYGKSAEADAIVKEYNDFIADYNSGHNGKKPKVLVLMGLPGSYLTATQNSYAGSLVELAGGENVFHDDTKDFLTVNTEEMLLKDPDVIIRTAHGLPDEAIEMFEKEFSQNDIWKHFRAVEEGRVYDVDYMLFGMSASFDYPQALAELEPMLYGE